MFSFPYYIIAVLVLFWNQIRKFSEIDKTKDDPSAFEIVLTFIFFLVFLHYVVFKLMLYYKYLVWISIFEFDYRLTVSVVAMIIAFVLGFPLSKIFYWGFKRIALLLSKHIIDDRHDSTH